MSCMIRAEYGLPEDSRGSKPRGGCSIATTSTPGVPPRRQAPSGLATKIAVKHSMMNLRMWSIVIVAGLRANGRVLALEELGVCSIDPNQDLGANQRGCCRARFNSAIFSFKRDAESSVSACGGEIEDFTLAILSKDLLIRCRPILPSLAAWHIDAQASCTCSGPPTTITISLP